MSALGGDDVVSGVSLNIRRMFSREELKAIYKNLPEQNIQKPYAFIDQIDAKHTNDRGNRAYWRFMLDVRVHPEDNRTDVQSWARGVALKLIEAINTITVSGQPVKALSIEYKVQDNVLHFLVSYGYRVLHIEDEVPDMQTITYGTKLKNKILSN